ncbi:hypothetical protein BDN70DRAFT_997028 [Pholiota conissans]|uniref:Protein kinase domain-containing protein n=1 Tax=Pholiota conissans TaxID=109636 RepID=A0A9P6CWE1_9AGAR|nr:hypothetical protein BDN70DRAFT_997028 [Pholiota conissans]
MPETHFLNYLANSTTKLGRSAAKADLDGRIIQNDASVFEHLRLSEVNADFVADCAHSLKAMMKTGIGTLQDVASMTDGKSIELLEQEEKADKDDDPNKQKTGENHGTAEEQTMHDLPLVANGLGQDSVICILDNREAHKLVIDKSKGDYSSVATPIVEYNGKWYTIGSPNCIFLSLLGRGTQVCTVREYYLEGDPSHQAHLMNPSMNVKTACTRTAESDIHLSIQDPIPAIELADFEYRDVYFPGSVHLPIIARNSRLLESDSGLATSVLHCLIPSTIGRPLWVYESDQELLTGLRDAVKAHKELCEKGILHRDISVENVLLGLITDMDLEFVRIKYSGSTKPIPVLGDPISVKRGAAMTGTIQFMTYELLKNNGVVHEEKHDVESFVWVLSYCVLRSLCLRAFEHNGCPLSERKEIGAIFQNAFGQTKRQFVANLRTGQANTVTFPNDSESQVSWIIQHFMSKALVKLFEDVGSLPLRKAALKEPLTHESLLLLVNNAIAEIEIEFRK